MLLKKKNDENYDLLGKSDKFTSNSLGTRKRHDKGTGTRTSVNTSSQRSTEHLGNISYISNTVA